jgi:hypothetical protein
MKETLLLAYFWVIFLARGFFYVSFLPLWEGFDEWAHYAVIQRLALGKEVLTARGDRVSREIDASLKAAPWVGPLSRDAYWQMPDSSRSNYEQTLRSMPVEWTRESAATSPPMYEA